MKMRALIIDDDARVNIKSLVEHAEAHRVSRRMITRAVEDPKYAIGNDASYSVIIPMGYRCVFSIEDQPIGWCRHLSVSVENPDPETPLPSPESIVVLMREFGFRGSLVGTLVGRVWIEEQRAINVVEKM